MGMTLLASHSISPYFGISQSHILILWDDFPLEIHLHRIEEKQFPKKMKMISFLLSVYYHRLYFNFLDIP